MGMAANLQSLFRLARWSHVLPAAAHGKTSSFRRRHFRYVLCWPNDAGHIREDWYQQACEGITKSAALEDAALGVRVDAVALRRTPNLKARHLRFC
jgi:hypothetical protein